MMEQKDKASNQHPAYGGLEAKRDVYRAVYGGTDSIRATGAKNLPKYPAESDSEFKARLNQATIDGIVQGGVDQLCGSVFEGEIDTTKVAASLVPYLENIDNKGNAFNVFARDAFRASFEGFSLILVDMPTEQAEDAEQERQLGLRPYFNLYCADAVINWRYQVNPVSKQKELVLLVLREVTSEPAGKFTSKDVTRYRVFMLTMLGLVTWELWEEVKTTGTTENDLVFLGGGIIDGVDQIPVAFIGDVEADPKLLVESRLEIKAYQKESSFDVIEYLSIPTFYTKGYEGEASELKLGASAWVQLPLEGEVGYAQIDAAGHDSLKATIREIKNSIRARVNYIVAAATGVAQKTPDKTATQVAVEDKDKQARLVVWANELKDALETALMFAGQFVGLGKDEAGEIGLRTKWIVAAEMAEQMQAAAAKEKDADDAKAKGATQ